MRRLTAIAAMLVLSSAMQTIIFPVMGPLPFARAQLAWVALVPWLCTLFWVLGSSCRPLLISTVLSYVCGILWYLGHCYWIFQTMHQYGGLSSAMAALVLLLFCCYLGLYHALFGAVIALVWPRRARQVHPLAGALLIACAWVAVEMARARVTSFPWDLMGYSQIDNAALTAVVPFTGVYGISFLLAFVNGGISIALLQSLLSRPRQKGTYWLPPSRRLLLSAGCAVATAAVSVTAGLLYRAPRPATDAQAIAVQPNLDPASQSTQPGTPTESGMAALTVAALGHAPPPAPRLILWPEAPTPFELHERSLQATLTGLAARSGGTVLADSNAVELDNSRSRRARIYNSAGLFTAGGLQARYDKIHLVPFGEFVPFADVFQFAGGLTQQVGNFDRGSRRVPLFDGRHRYGVFICYESIFPEEVRQLALKGADVLVNLSDDGWYGDTSAPFQHSNMARMRAIENRRWLLRDTNTGITESIDPYGNVRTVAPRHQALAAALPFSFSTVQTFYTKHGDILAWLCVAITILTALWSLYPSRDLPSQ